MSNIITMGQPWRRQKSFKQLQTELVIGVNWGNQLTDNESEGRKDAGLSPINAVSFRSYVTNVNVKTYPHR